MSSAEHGGGLQYWTRDNAQDCTDLPPLDCVAESAIRSTRRAAALTADAWKAPTLNQWQRLRIAATLQHDRTDSNRDAKCQRTRFRKDVDVGISRSSSGKWTAKNVIQCGRMTCPVCGVRRARRVASQIGACIERHQEGIECDVWMLTLSPPHRADDSLELTLDRLYVAAADFFRTPAWRRFAKEYEIDARIRVLDATHGGQNGCHPHFHIALFPRHAYALSSYIPAAADVKRYQKQREEWSDELIEKFVHALRTYDEKSVQATSLWDAWQPLRIRPREVRGAFLAQLAREQLVDAWRSSCARAGVAIPDRAAFDRHALTLSPSEDAAAYFTKWGLADEVASSPQKARSHLRLLDLVEAGHDLAGDLYIAFREATCGKQWISGLGDAMAELGVHDEDADAYLERLARRRAAVLAAAGTPLPDLLPLDLHIRGYLYPAALKVGWETVFALCDAEAEAATSELDVQRALDRFLWSQLGSRASPSSVAEENPCC